jgi:hypothetical protein
MEQGLITDDNGEAITDMGKLGVTWASSVTKEFQKIVDKLDALLTKLGLTKDAINDIPKTVDVTVNYNQGTIPPPPDNGSGPLQPAAFTTVSGATLMAMERNALGAAAAQRPIEVVVISQLDGRAIARNQIRLLPDALGVYGVR